ncbi:hypothetical protein PCANC_16856 [Puccinia coronata f. sp. avenae]|uniref:Uncharacterized protein n=1 Tax=Puccinia coronata f. sp. avenae TaxID=200324 RepID=A0A2N5TH97_9BASI|nr:hypothetical protein PCANC_16856 [Puccinia coronata f. sp. avenae]PLW24886.1 hypothetical protein PCASD_24984 [Puccinia coronata f. sp. avenae]
MNTSGTRQASHITPLNKLPARAYIPKAQQPIPPRRAPSSPLLDDASDAHFTEKCSGDDYKVWVNITEYYACEACNEKISGAIEYEAGVLSGPPPIGQAAETGVIQPTNNVINALSRLRTSGLNCYPRQKTQEEKNWREIQWNNEFEIDKEI